MARMLGKSMRRHPDRSAPWYCCYGHDGWNRVERIFYKRSQRRREKRGDQTGSL